MDKNRDGFWDKDEFIGNLTIGRGKPLLVAVRPGGLGNVTASRVEWEFNRGIPEVPSPILHDRLIYMVSNGGVLTCVDADLGKWSTAGDWAGTDNTGPPGDRREPPPSRFRGRIALPG